MPITCTAPVLTINNHTLVHLPKPVSAKLPSRGMAMAKGTVNGKECTLPLEPDGKGSHWFSVTKPMQTAIKGANKVELSLEPLEDWPEPEIPQDLKKALQGNSKAHETWVETTALARWDWIRSIRSTNNPATRVKRITVAIDKLRKGQKRQCCFNRSMCTVPEVSKSGVLLID